MKSIRIFGKVWTIKYRPGKDFDEDDIYGLCRHEELTIWLREGLAPDIERDTLWHEIKGNYIDDSL